ncbi:hypothetical protein RBB50_008350 [Rhinocladiella similis]
MTSSRTEWPCTPVSDSVKALLNTFGALVDSKSADVGQRLSEDVFTPTGSMIVNKKVSQGREEIRRSRDGTWAGVASRKHEFIKVYTCNEPADDLLLIGKLTWVFSNGTALETTFTARAIVDQPAAVQPKLELYQAWVVRLIQAFGRRDALKLVVQLAG